MIFGLLIILLCTLILPFVFKKVEHNLELFLFIMGLSSVLVSGVLSRHLIKEIIENRLMYMITAAVLIAGILFKLLKSMLKRMISLILRLMSIRIFILFTIVILGLISSIITAIIASLILVEIVSILPLNRTKKIEITIVACFSIGIGAVLTPIGEPVSTIVVSKLGEDFWYIYNLVGIYVIAGILLLGVLGMWLVQDKKLNNIFKRSVKSTVVSEIEDIFGAENFVIEDDDFRGIILRTFKIFLFIISLELLGAGFKPIIDTYIINFDTRILYCGNMVSAVLDNATIAAAEISIKMSGGQIRAILIGLLVSGGMLIPGNIPNIISAGKLKIKSSEWIKLGVPIGLSLLLLYYLLLFVL